MEVNIKLEIKAFFTFQVFDDFTLTALAITFIVPILQLRKLRHGKAK